MQQVKVWDIFVRLFHWSLVLFFTLAYLTGEGELETLHAWFGYIIGALISLRIIWGFIGTKYARFSNFVYRPSNIKAYLQSLFTRHPKHYLGHNPAGGAMVVVMLLVLALVTWTGLETYAAEGKGPLATMSLEISVAHADDGEQGDWSRASGSDFWEEIHEFSANLMLLLIFVHIAGVLASSLLHGENLPRAMVSGRKTIQNQDKEG